jgi:transposase
MPRFKSYSYEQTRWISVDFKNQLQPGTFEFAVNEILDEMDLSFFNDRFHNDETGAPAYDPAILLKVVLFAYSRGITSSREIERACRENVVFIALSADSRPHFTTIAAFISSMKEEITPLFRNVLMVCAQEGLIGRQMFAVDGCKLSANCAKEWSGTHADLRKKKEKMEEAIRVLLRQHREIDRTDEDATWMREKAKDSVTRLRSKVRKLETWLQSNEDKVGPSGKVRQSNLTDNESAKMPGAHGVVQGYNGLAAVDAKHQVIVHAEAFGEGAEKRLLKPLMDGLRENLTAVGVKGDPLHKAVVVADNGYHSEENARLVFEEGIEAYLPDSRFRKRDPAFATASRHRRAVDRKKLRYRPRPFFGPSDFTFDPKKKTLVCPAGKELGVKVRNFRSHDGYVGTAYMGRVRDCRACSLRSKCLRKSHTPARQVVIFRGRDQEAPPTFCRRMMERFDTPRGRFLYSRRMGIVEPVFGNLRHALGLDHFTLRGREKVNIQWKLYGMVHNLLKILRYGPRFA